MTEPKNWKDASVTLRGPAVLLLVFASTVGSGAVGWDLLQPILNPSEAQRIAANAAEDREFIRKFRIELLAQSKASRTAAERAAGEAERIVEIARGFRLELREHSKRLDDLEDRAYTAQDREQQTRTDTLQNKELEFLRRHK